MWDPRDGISAHIQRDTRELACSLSFSLLPYEDTERRQPSESQEESSHWYQTKLGSTRPMHSKASPLTLGCGAGKYSIYCRVPNKENRQLMFRIPELSNDFQGRVLKTV